MFCDARIRPTDDVECNGNPRAISHGICVTCKAIIKADPDMPVAEVRRRSVEMANSVTGL
jgi:hypothetical protein